MFPSTEDFSFDCNLEIKSFLFCLCSSRTIRRLCSIRGCGFSNLCYGTDLKFCSFWRTEVQVLLFPSRSTSEGRKKKTPRWVFWDPISVYVLLFRNQAGRSVPGQALCHRPSMWRDLPGQSLSSSRFFWWWQSRIFCNWIPRCLSVLSCLR